MNTLWRYISNTKMHAIELAGMLSDADRALLAEELNRADLNNIHSFLCENQEFLAYFASLAPSQRQKKKFKNDTDRRWIIFGALIFCCRGIDLLEDDERRGPSVFHPGGSYRDMTYDCAMKVVLKKPLMAIWPDSWADDIPLHQERLHMVNDHLSDF